MFKIFAMPLLAITIITWNTTAWGIISDDQIGTEEGDCYSSNALGSNTLVSGGGQNCSAPNYNYMCKGGQCIKSCTACTVGDLQDGSLIIDFSCKYKTCGTSGTSCTASRRCSATWSNTNVNGYMYRTCTGTKEDCSLYTEYEYKCADGYSATELSVSCYNNLSNGTFSLCTGCEEDEQETPSCDAGQYLSGNSCTTCPPDYPNSVAGSDAITDCYSKPKTREWSGTQTECSTPSGCASVTCNTCSRNPCTYVAYSNGAGTGDGDIKDGCQSNSAACQQTVASVTASANHYVSGTTCPACLSYSSEYPSSAGGNITSSSCYGSFSKSGSQEECHPTSDNVVSYTCKACTLVSCTYTKYASGTIKEDCTPTNCTQDVESVTCKSGYYPQNNECILCDSGYYCNGSEQKRCPEIESGSGKFGTSEAGSTSINDCYVPNNPEPLTATDDTGTYVCISDAYYKTGTN